MPDSSSCGYFEYDAHGRQGIGVAQPRSGIDYPLVTPSDDITHLLADFYFCFDPPHYYEDVPERVPPFHIHWLYGFGCETGDYPIPVEYGGSLSSWGALCTSSAQSVSSNSSYSYADCLPVPQHAHDIIIHDANNRVVFDSTGSDITYASRSWGDRLRIVTWTHDKNATCSIVYHTAWSPNDDPPPKTYPLYFFPSHAVLDSRAIEPLPKRVKSITVVLDNMTKTAIDFSAGYNMRITKGATTFTAGTRSKTPVTFNAVAGAGLGVFPGCEPEQLWIRTINNTSPTDEGDFSMAASGCYWVRQPTRVISTNPRITAPEISLTPGSIPTIGLPAANAGTAKNLAGWPTDDDPRYAHLQIGNDCGPCCDCEDYVAVANYMNSTRDRYHDIGVLTHNSLLLYHNNRQRWLNSASCMVDRALRLRLQPQICPFLDVAAQYCNHTTACQTDVELSVTLVTEPAGGSAIEVPGFTFISGVVTSTDDLTGQPERYTMDGEWPVFRAYFDTVQPGASVSVRFRLRFDNCGVANDAGSVSASEAAILAGSSATPFGVTAVLRGEIGGAAISGNSGALEVEATRTLNCPPKDGDTFNPLVCACEK